MPLSTLDLLTDKWSCTRKIRRSRRIEVHLNRYIYNPRTFYAHMHVCVSTGQLMIELTRLSMSIRVRRKYIFLHEVCKSAQRGLSVARRSGTRPSDLSLCSSKTSALLRKSDYNCSSFRGYQVRVHVSGSCYLAFIQTG